MTSPIQRFRLPGGARLPAAAALAVALVLGPAACGDDPFQINWVEQPDTALMYSLARPELNLASGFSLLQRSLVRVEAADATGSWDVALDTRGGQLVFLPPGALNVVSQAGIAPVPDTEWDEVTQAPTDSASYVSDAAVPVELGTIYVVRTSQGIGAFGRRCVYFGKMEALELDLEGGTLTFMYDRSPVCNDRRLIPPD